MRRRRAEACATVHGKCHREQTAGGLEYGGIAQGDLRDVFAETGREPGDTKPLGKGEKVG